MERLPKSEIISFVQKTAADPINLFTAVLAAFTIVLAGASIWQGRLTRESIDLAGKEFVATHRPRLRVRMIQTDGLGGATFVLVVNIGESNAEITGIAGMFASQKDRRWVSGRPDFSRINQPPAELRSLASGQARSFALSMGAVGPKQTTAITQKNEILYVTGIIKYVDDNKIERTTGFGWPYDPDSGEFFNPEKTTEYNYED